MGSKMITDVETLKQNLKVVDKVWGREIWIVNSSKYCGKLLILNKGAKCSYHCHLIKEETFYALEGQVALTIGDIDTMLNPYSRPKTIKPGQYHTFYGISEAIILEISTHHDDTDCIRLTQSSNGIS